VMRTFKATAEAKIECVAKYVEHLVGVASKFLLFAHHHVMLDALEQKLMALGVGHIRIDGRTPTACRLELVERYQNNEDVRVALLSITACGQGLTLTAGHTVVFAEMYWVPGQMLQAEDRAHRIGQKSHVEVHYCIAEGTLDERMFELLEKKYRVASGILDGRERSMNVRPSTVRQLTTCDEETCCDMLAHPAADEAQVSACQIPGPDSSTDTTKPLGGGPFGKTRKRAREEQDLVEKAHRKHTISTADATSRDWSGVDLD